MLLAGTIIGGLAAPAPALNVPTPIAATPQPTRTAISLAVVGNRQLEHGPVLSYAALGIGEPYDRERLDQALRDLYATELFADVVIARADVAQIIELCGDPASAQAARTWVSGVGDDVNPCSRTAPCKTFAGAISKAATGGEINCLDLAAYSRRAAGVEPKIVQLDPNHVEESYVRSFDSDASNVRSILTDRFFLGTPQMRSFDIRGAGPLIRCTPHDCDIDAADYVSNVTMADDHVGALWGVRMPALLDIAPEPGPFARLQRRLDFAIRPLRVDIALKHDISESGNDGG